jgi:hypothetical protein
MNVRALAPALGNHRIDAGLADHAIGDQHGQEFRQCQFVFPCFLQLHTGLQK